MAIKKYLSASAIVLALICPANAWGSRCNPDEARAQYVCTALLTCTKLHTNYQELQALTTYDKVAAFIDKFFAASPLPEISPLWEQPINGQKFDKLDIARLKEANRRVFAVMILSAINVIQDIKTAPISDYQCQANITFYEAGLVSFSTAQTYVQFFANPIANENYAIGMADTKMFNNWVSMQATTFSQCINRNPVYTEGLGFEPKDLTSCH